MPGNAGLYEVWVQAIAEDGTFGLGKCSFGQPVASYIDHVIAPVLEGQNCMAIELMNDLVIRGGHRHGLAGIVSTALSGVDIALWDLKGKLLQRPVYELLGGPVRDKIALYATGDDLDWFQELGFTRFKITNPAHYSQGDEGLRIIEEHVAKSRDIVGEHAELMINPVMSFNVEFALRLAERLRPYNLRWLEEPLPPHDIEGHVELKRAITWIPLATGEDHRGRHAFAQLIERRAIDIVQPDIGWSGGITETMKIYNIAETAGIQTIPHGGAVSPWGTARRNGSTRITHRRMLDRITTRHPSRRNEPHPRNANRQRRLHHTIQRPRIRDRNPLKLDPKLAIQKPYLTLCHSERSEESPPSQSVRGLGGCSS